MGLYQVCSNCDQGQKNALPPGGGGGGGHMFYIGLHRENVKKIFLSGTTRSKALIFGMWHQLLNLYQVCSNYDPGAKNGPSPGSHVLHGLIYRNMKKSSYMKPQCIEP